MSTHENCTAENCYQCLTNRFWKMHDVFLNTSARLINCENEKRQLQAQLANGKSEIRQLDDCLNEANTAIGNYEIKIEKLESELLASQEESARKIQELQEQQNLKVRALQLELSAVQKKSCEKILELQEQHDKKLSRKDLEIQQLEIMLAGARKEKIQEINAQEQVSVKDTEMMPNHVEIPQSNEPTLLQEAKKAQEALMTQLAAKDKEIENLTDQLEAKDQEATNIREQHISKLAARDSEVRRSKEKVKDLDERNENQRKSIYHYRQIIKEKDRDIEALKERVAELEAEPQEALIAQLAAKDKEMEYLKKQHEEKLAAQSQENTNIREHHEAKLAVKDSEIQRFTEMVQNGDEKNENLQKIIYKFQKMIMEKDREIGEMKERVTDLEAELQNGQDGQSEQ
ncbi:hypothetical protein GCK72_015909 [Caenorhabditis remanei]|uniref:Uncharacterized protein n=1 Tax=Caenorhabditis remanei TaxID=31234 RepID=A0A6A5GYS3_CAERE|nr:hypothetical protein GCK72_015909 [Caenorhabditis remanei]KAF1759442.1 hypothetical protein GCK72_015909 [Caenorhabditis remanei]